MTQEEYSDIFHNTQGPDAQKLRAVLIAYADPPKKLFQPGTWFSNRTWREEIIRAIGRAESGCDLEFLLQMISAEFATNAKRMRIKPAGDFSAALSAIVSVMPKIQVNYFRSTQPFLALRGPLSPLDLSSSGSLP